MSRTLITLSIESLGNTIDLDLPDNIPLGELMDMIFRNTSGWIPIGSKREEFNYLISDGELNWRSIDLNMTLEEAQVMDGYCLRMEKSQSFSTASVNERDTLRQNEIPLF